MTDLQDSRHAPPILGIALGCVAYVAAHRVGRPMFNYLPEIQEWSTGTPGGLIAMGYYGMIPYALLGFVVGWALAKVPGVDAWLATRGARLLTVTATAAIAGALLYHVGVELTGHAES